MSATLTPERAALLGRVGAHVAHSRHDSREMTAAARAAFLDRFERDVDPDGTPPVAERRRRAEHLRKAHFARLALRSADVRRARAQPPCADPPDKENAAGVQPAAGGGGR